MMDNNYNLFQVLPRLPDDLFPKFIVCFTVLRPFISSFQINVDDCIGVSCPIPGQVCVDLVESYECRCPQGFSGQECVENVNECNNRTGLCQNGATCLDASGTYRCLCRSGYTGRHCEETLDVCALKK